MAKIDMRTMSPQSPPAGSHAAALPESVDALKAALAAAQAQVAALKSRGVGRITCKVSEKGALSVYGLGRFPVTLYRGQWERLLSAETVAQVNAFIAANVGSLATKD